MRPFVWLCLVGYLRRPRYPVPPPIGTRLGYILLSLLRLAPASGISSCPSSDWHPVKHLLRYPDTPIPPIPPIPRLNLRKAFLRRCFCFVTTHLRALVGGERSHARQSYSCVEKSGVWYPSRGGHRARGLRNKRDVVTATTRRLTSGEEQTLLDSLHFDEDFQWLPLLYRYIHRYRYRFPMAAPHVQVQIPI